MHRGEKKNKKNEGSSLENKENALEGEKEDKNKKDKEAGVCTEAGKETSCRQSDKRCLVQKSRAKKKKADEERFIKDRLGGRKKQLHQNKQMNIEVNQITKKKKNSSKSEN